MWFPSIVGTGMFFTIGSIMWIWMKGYVGVQKFLYGDGIFLPKNRMLPQDFSNEMYGTHAYVKLNEITMHYVTKGCDENNDVRPMLLMLHGFLDFWYIWNRQIPYLSKYFCVVAPDLRGYGNTSKPEHPADYVMEKLVEDVHNLIVTLNKDKRREVVLVGHDWGGMITFCFANRYENQGLFSKIVIINGMHLQALKKELLQSITQMRKSWYMISFQKADVPEQYIMMEDLRFFDNIHKNAFTEAEEEASKYVFSQPRALTSALNYYRAFNYDIYSLDEKNYRKLNVSALILWGEQDEFLTTRVALYNQEWLTRSRLIFYPRGGHWLMREYPEQLNEEIIKFSKEETVTVKETRKVVMRRYVEASNESETFRPNITFQKLMPGVPRNVKLPRLPGGN